MRLTTRAALTLPLIAAAMTTFALVTVEVGGALGGVIASGHPVVLGLGDAIRTALAVFGDLRSVSRGDWPVRLREQLPRREQLQLMLLVGAVAGFAMLMLPLAGLRMLRSDRRGRHDDTAARMATPRDLKRLFVRGAGNDRVVLGRVGGRLVAAEANASTLIVAPAQSHKTTGLVIPALLEWQGPVVATSVKGDLLVDTIAARRQIGEVKIFDPMGSTAYPSDCWSPVLQATSWSRARSVAAGLLQIDVAGGAHQSQDKAFWRPSAQGYLAALIFAANISDRSMADVSRWIDASGPGDVGKACRALREAASGRGFAGAVVRDATDALQQVDRIWDEEFDSRTRSSMLLTLSTALYAWGEHSVQDATDDHGTGITAEWLLDGSNTLFLVAPIKDQQRLQGMFSALIQTIVDEAFMRSARTGCAIDPRLLLIIDEAANTAPLPSLDAIASTGPGQGVTTLTVLQNLSQATHAWGRDKAQTIVTNHRAKIFGAGISDADTLRYLDTLLGDQARQRASVSKDRGKLIELGSRTESIEHRKLLGPNQLREAKEGSSLLVYGNLPPARMKLRPWFKDRRLKQLRNTPEPALAAPSPLPPLPSPAANTTDPQPTLPLGFDGDELDVDELLSEDLAAARAATAPLEPLENEGGPETPPSAYDDYSEPEAIQVPVHADSSSEDDSGDAREDAW